MVENGLRHAALRVPPSIGAAIALLIHILVAVLLFLAIGAAAVVLSMATRWCQDRKLVAPWIIQGMNALEIFLWASDALCFVLFVLSEVSRFCIRLWKAGEVKRVRQLYA